MAVKTTDRMMVNGVTYMIKDTKAQTENAAISETTSNLIVFNTDEFSVRDVHGVSSGHGTFVLDGTASMEAVMQIADDFQLPAGVYYFGCVPDVTDAGIIMQLRDIVGGVDMGNIVATGNYEKVTITSAKTVRVRIHFNNGTNYDNVEVCPILAKATDWFKDFVPHESAADYVVRNAFDLYGLQYREQPTTDMDDFTEPGVYILGANTVYDHSPDGIARVSFLICFRQKGSDLAIQMYIAPGSKLIFIRRRAGNPMTWESWSDFNLYNFKANTYSAEETDLDNFTETGSYQLSASTSYTHSPVDGPRPSMLLVFRERSASDLRVQLYFDITNRFVYIRRKAGSPMTWSGWNVITSPTENNERSIPESFAPASNASQGANVGDKIRVMSYNICQFNNDSSVYISDSKLLNLRKMFYQANADILMLQEDREYIDSGNTKASMNYMYLPVYPTTIGAGGANIRSKMSLTNGGTVFYNTTGRVLRYAVHTIGSKVILVVSTHPIWKYNGNEGDSAESIAARKTEYEELFKWVAGAITLKNGSNVDVTVPAHTHCIIGMDGNSATATDKTNLLNEASTVRDGVYFVAGNGGAIGWYITEMRSAGSAIDNIFVSNNIIINSIESWNDWYSKLYSDHVPVVADLTLL